MQRQTFAVQRMLWCRCCSYRHYPACDFFGFHLFLLDLVIIAGLSLTAIVYHLVTLKALRVSVYIYRSKPVTAAWAVTAFVLMVFHYLVTPFLFFRLYEAHLIQAYPRSTVISCPYQTQAVLGYLHLSKHTQKLLQGQRIKCQPIALASIQPRKGRQPATKILR